MKVFYKDYLILNDLNIKIKIINYLNGNIIKYSQ